MRPTTTITASEPFYSALGRVHAAGVPDNVGFVEDITDLRLGDIVLATQFGFWRLSVVVALGKKRPTLAYAGNADGTDVRELPVTIRAGADVHFTQRLYWPTDELALDQAPAHANARLVMAAEELIAEHQGRPLE